MKVEDANLLTINALKNKYSCNVGYSGHENGVAVSLAAFMLGISSLERILRLIEQCMVVITASLEPKGMKNLTDSIDKMYMALGSEMLGNILEEEIPIANKLRAHIKS